MLNSRVHAQADFSETLKFETTAVQILKFIRCETLWSASVVHPAAHHGDVHAKSSVSNHHWCCVRETVSRQVVAGVSVRGQKVKRILNGYSGLDNSTHKPQLFATNRVLMITQIIGVDLRALVLQYTARLAQGQIGSSKHVMLTGLRQTQMVSKCEGKKQHERGPTLKH